MATCDKCGGSGHPVSPQSRTAICDHCGGKGYVGDPPPVEDVDASSTRGLETTKAAHEIKDPFGRSDDPMDNDGGH